MSARRGSLHRTHCAYCAQPLNALERFSGEICSRPMCRRRHLESKLAAFRQRAAEALGDPALAALPVVVVPHRTGRLVPTAQARPAFEAHVRELVARMQPRRECDVEGGAGTSCTPAAEQVQDEPVEQARDEPVEQVQDEPAEQPTAALVCSACRGACCYHGGPFMAFVDEQTIGDFSAAHRDVAPEGVVAAYLDRIPERHFEDSCVYHAENGCALPRALRAAICNQYECRGLKDANELRTGARAQGLFVVVRHDNEIMRGTFADPGQSRQFADDADDPVPGNSDMD